MNKHTPGPWKIDNSRARTAINTDEKHVAMVNCGTHVEKSEHEANCRLIAAAPEMLEMLEDVEKWLRDITKTGGGQSTRLRANAILKLIKKAKGEV